METNTKLMRNNLFTWLQTNLAGGAKTLLLAATLLCGVSDAWGRETNYLINDAAEYPLTKSSGLGYNDLDKTFGFDKPCSKIEYDLWEQSGAVSGGAAIYGYTDASCTTGEKKIASDDGKNNQYNHFSHDVNDRSFRGIKFRREGTLQRKIKNVKVYQATYLEVDNVEKQTSVTKDFGTSKVNDANSTATFVVNYSNVDNMTIQITGEGVSQFTIDKTLISGGKGSYGNETVTVTYKHDKAGTHTGVVTVSDGTSSLTINLTGTTTKYDPAITWVIADQIANGEQIQESQVATTPSAGCTVTFSSSNEGVVKFEDGYLKAVGAGDVTLTAHVHGNDVFSDKDFTKTINVTNKTIQTITWNQTLTSLKTTDGTVDLTAAASSGLTCRYESSNTSVVSVSGSTLTIVGEGEAFVTAYQDGNGTYAPATPYENPVLVFDPTKPCPTDLIQVAGKHEYTSNESAIEYSIGTANKITINAKRNALVTNNFYIDQYIPNEGWSNKFEQLLDRDEKDYSFDIDYKATKIRAGSKANGGHICYWIKYTPETHTSPSVSAMSFASLVGTNPPSQTFTVDNANAKVFITTTNSNFTVSPTSLGDCGLYTNQKITVGYNAPSEARTEPETGAIVFTNHMGQEVARVNLSATVDKIPQQITSHNIGTSYTTTDRITLSAVSNSGLTEFTYTPNPSGVANVNGNVLTFNKSCDNLSITINQAGTNKYSPTSLEVSNIVISPVTPTISTPPTATVVYGQRLNSATLNGGAAKVNPFRGEATDHAVEGGFSWTDGSTVVTNQAGTYPATYGVTFASSGTEAGMYNNQTGNATVTVNKATPTLTVTNPATQKVYLDDTQTPKLDLVSCVTAYSAADDTHGHPQAKAAITYTCDKTSTGKIENGKFYATAEGTYIITATAPGTDYYNKVEQTFTITVVKNENPITFQAGSSTVTTTTVDCGSSSSVNIVTASDGTLSVSGAQNGVTPSLSGKTLTFAAAAGNSNKTATFTVSQATTTKYKADSATITVNVKPIFYFEAAANVNNASAGTASASVIASQVEDFNSTSSTATFTFTASAANPGYTWDGWYNGESKLSSDATYTPNLTNSTPDSKLSVTYTAKFTTNTYTITYNLDGGDNDPLNPAAYTVESNDIVLQDAVKNGYFFDGWYDAATGGNKITQISKGSTGNKTLYAHWGNSYYIVSFNANGGSGSMDNEIFVMEETKALSANTFTAPAASTYSVTFNSDGGSACSAITPAGLTFNGWEDHGNMMHSGTLYTWEMFDAPYYSNNNNDLYNAFKYNKYLLLNHYVGQVIGAGEKRNLSGFFRGTYPTTEGVSQLSLVPGEVVPLYAQWKGTITLPTPTREYYTFLGWYIGDKKFGDGGQTVDICAPNVTLTAKWQAAYTVVFNGNGNTGGTAMDNLIYYYDQDYTLPANTYTRQYTTHFSAPDITWSQADELRDAPFEGWEDRGRIQYNDTVWNYTDFDAALYGTNSADVRNHEQYGNGTYNKYLLLTHFVEHGRREWKGGAQDRRPVDEGNPGKYPDQTKVANLTNLTGESVNLYAHWGTATSAITLPTVTRTGYTCSGWYDNDTKVGDCGESYYPAKDAILIAKWTANSYGITYLDEGGATFSGTHESGYPTAHTYGAVTNLKSATKQHYAFGGWYTSSDCTGSATTSIGATAYTSAITLYAKWIPIAIGQGQQQAAINITESGTTAKTTTMTFAVQNSTAVTDFSDNPASIEGEANGWEITGWEYTSTSLVTVNLKFTAVESTTPKGDNTATVRLNAKSGQGNTGTATAGVNITPVYTCNIADNYKVDDARLDLQSLWTSSGNGAITYSVEQITGGGVSDAGHKTEVTDNRYLSLGEAGTWKLTLSQAAGTSSDAKTVTKNITISKYATTLSVLLGGAEQPNNTITLYYGDGIFVEPSSNSDALIEGTQLDEGVCGTYYHDPVTGTFYAAATSGTAQCRLTQAETYKYAATTLDFYVIVTTKTDGCDVLELKKGDLSLYGNAGPWPMSGPGGNIVYSLESNLELQVSKTENGTYTTIGTGNGTYDLSTSQYADYKYIRVRNTGLLSRSYTINAIPRNRFIKPSVTELSPKKVLLGSSATNTFDVSYSVCPGGPTVDGNVRIQSSNRQEGLFTVTPDNISTGTDATAAGTVTISATYTPSKVGFDTTILAVYTRFDKQRVYVYAECLEKWTPTAHWNYGDGEVVFYSGDGDQTPNIYATDDNGDTMSGVQWHFESSNTAVAIITNDGKIHPVGVGTTVITAYVEESTTCYQSQPVTQTIYISDGTVITLNPNGGTGDGSVHVGYGRTTLDNTPNMSRTGYTLKGYYTASTGGAQVVNTAAQLQPGTTYTDGSSHWISKDATAILDAQWTANTYTVSFDRNGHGGTGTLTTQKVTYDVAMAQLPNSHILKETGSTFLGYWDAPEGGTQYYTEKGASAHTWDKTADTKLYAHWIGADFFTWGTLSYNANGAVPSDIAKPYSKLAVTYTSSNSAVVSVAADGKTMFAHKVGQVELTATTAEDPNHYYSVITDTKTITIDSCTQTVNFPQFETFYADEMTGRFSADIVLNMASVVDASGTPIEGHQIYYSVVNSGGIASITEANGVYTLHINGIGNATVKAYVKADTVYKSASATQDVVVKAHAEPCNTMVTDNSSHTLREASPSFEVPLNNVPYDTLIATISKSYSLSATVQIYGIGQSGDTIIEFNVSQGEADGTPRKYYLENKVLSKLIFHTSVATGLGGTYTVKNITVKQSKYLTASIDHIEEQPYISDMFSKDFTVTYSDQAPIHATITNHNGMILTREEPDANDCGNYGTYHYSVSTSTSSQDAGKVLRDTIHITTPAGGHIIIPVQLTYVLGELYQFGTIGQLTDTLDWEDLNNWWLGGDIEVPIHPEHLPTIKNTVQLLNPVRINSHVEVYGITRSIDFTPEDAKIIITPTGGLTVYNGDIAGRKYYSNNIIIEATKEHQGYLRISPNAMYKTLPLNVVSQFATKSTLSTGANKDATWQYFGVPGEGGIDFTVDGITWLYDWQEKMGWVPMTGTNHLEPFHGYVITQYGQPTYNFVGKMTTENQDITLTYTPSGMGGSNIFANSYTAPIEVKNFTEEDFEGDIDKTFYLYNAGSWNQWKSEKDSVSVSSDSRDNTPGTYYAIPALSAVYLTDQQTTIPSLSGVFVIAHEDGAKIHLNYRKHVWNVGAPVTDSVAMHRPLRAPQRVAGSMEEEPFNLPLDTIKVDTTNYAALLSHRVVIRLTSENSGYDRITLLEKTDDSHFTAGYDNGYDAQKIPAEGIANIYTTESEGNMAVSATNKLDGMYLGVLAGEDETYHLRCSSVVGDSLYLLDMVNGVETRIIEGMTYSFNASANSQNDRRFMIMEHEKKEPSIVTANNQIGERDAYIWTDPINLHIENASSNAHVRLYAADGKLIYATNINRTAVIPINDLPNSVYMVQIGDKTNKFIKK